MTTRRDVWLQCDRCDFGYSSALKSRGDQCGDCSWIHHSISVRIAAQDYDRMVELLACKGRVWPARWMTRRPAADIAQERQRLLWAAAVDMQRHRLAVKT